MLHETENTLETELFLKKNGKKFSQDCITAMKLMYQGVRLNGNTCKQLYGFHDRRLRDCRQARPDIVKSKWVCDRDNNERYVEFWIELPAPPTKKEVIKKWKGKLVQQDLFGSKIS